MTPSHGSEYHYCSYENMFYSKLCQNRDKKKNVIASVQSAAQCGESLHCCCAAVGDYVALGGELCALSRRDFPGATCAQDRPDRSSRASFNSRACRYAGRTRVEKQRIWRRVSHLADGRKAFLIKLAGRDIELVNITPNVFKRPIQNRKHSNRARPTRTCGLESAILSGAIV